MFQIVCKIFLGLIFFGSTLLGQDLKKENNYLFTQNQIQFSENSLDNPNHLDELIASLHSEDEKLFTLLQIAENYLHQNLYKESLKYIFQAENLAKNSNSENLKAFTYISLAAFYRGLELQKKAAENLEKVIDPLSLIKDTEEKKYIEARFQLEKGLLNFAVSKEKEGVSNLWKSKTKFRKSKNAELASKSLQLVYSKLGNYYLTQNELDSSKYYFDQNLNLSSQFQSFPELELRAKNGISKYYLQKKNADSALFFASGFSELIPNVKDARLKKDVFKNLAQIHYFSNELSDYKTYNQRYLSLNDSIYALDKETRVLLAKQADAGVETEPSGKFLWIMIVLGIALAVLFLTYAYHLKVKKEYAQFQKIMQTVNEKENLRLAEIQEANAGNIYIISEKTEQVILDKLKKFEDSERYINPKVSLQFLAKNLDTNTKYLSEIINKSKGQNFNNYINELRIHYILRKLKSEPKYQNYKVSSLAEECGFNSRNTFTLAFKNTLGMSPAKFISFIKKENFADNS